MLLPTRSDSIIVQEQENTIEVNIGHKRYLFPQEDCLLLPLKATTAELLAESFAREITIPEGLHLEVCVSENSGSRGCYSRD